MSTMGEQTEWGEDGKPVTGHPGYMPGYPQQRPSGGATRTAGSILLLALMIAAILFATITAFLYLTFQTQIAIERSTERPFRDIVVYQVRLETVNQEIRDHVQPPPAPPPENANMYQVVVPSEQMQIDNAKLDNTYLRHRNATALARIRSNANPRRPLRNAPPGAGPPGSG